MYLSLFIFVYTYKKMGTGTLQWRVSNPRRMTCALICTGLCQMGKSQAGMAQHFSRSKLIIPEWLGSLACSDWYKICQTRPLKVFISGKPIFRMYAAIAFARLHRDTWHQREARSRSGARVAQRGCLQKAGSVLS